jgi:NAD(P)-dependent dehydrogenase (short-subunit alcohol dehydrogenase family)
MSTTPLTIVLSGATGGIGREAARLLAGQGHRLVLLGRDEGKLGAVADELRDAAGSVETVVADNEDLSSVRTAVDRIAQRHGRVDVLCVNAGTVYDRRTVTRDGYEATFQVNHLAGFLLTELLRDRLGEGSRVVVTASVGHHQGTLDWDDLGFERGRYSTMRAYGRSKLANVLHARHLGRLLESEGVTVVSFHPGTVGTRIWNGAPWYARPVLQVAKLFMDSPEQGGEVLAWLATADEVQPTSGSYYDKRTSTSPSELARDDRLAARLYDESRRMVGLD